MSNYKLPEEDNGCFRQDYHDPHLPQGTHGPKLVLNCGNGTGLTLPIDSRGGCKTSFVAGTVSVDASGISCPKIKIDFSSMINFKAESRDGEFFIRLIFQLSRACDCGQKIPLSTWVYEKEVDLDRCRRIGVANGGEPSQINFNGGSYSEVEVDFKESFGFTWCECNNCSGCCLYVVEIIDIDTDNIRCLSLTNIGINALAS